MNNHDPSAETPGDNMAAPSTRARLLRGFADGELAGEELAEATRHLEAAPADQAVVDFERELRGAIARSAENAAPESLRESIASLRESTDGHRMSFPSAPAAPQRRWIRIAAIAATVALGVTAGLFVLDRSRSHDPAVRSAEAQRSHRVSVAAFVRYEHEECAVHEDVAARKFVLKDAATATHELSAILGTTPRPDLLEKAGFRFLGAGRCGVPGGTSVHMMFEAPPAISGDGSVAISLFAQADQGLLGITDGVTYSMIAAGADSRDASTSRGDAAYVWRSEGLVYFLVSHSHSTVRAALEAMQAPPQTGSI